MFNYTKLIIRLLIAIFMLILMIANSRPDKIQHNTGLAILVLLILCSI